MATSYTGKRVQDTYNAIIKIGDNSNLTGTAKLLSDGLGNDSPLYLSTTRLGIGITPAYQFHTSGNAKIGGNLIISGNLTVNGTLTYLNVEDLAVEDPLIKLAKDNTANTLDIGFFGKYVATGTKYKGLFNDASDDKFKLFIGTGTEPTTTVDITASGYSVGTLVANLEGNVTGTVSSLSNHTTSNLAEGTNLYYTTARFDTRFTSKDTDDLSEGSSNLYFTTARARASFTAGTGVTITNGEIAIGQAVATTSNVTFGNVTGGTISGTTGTFSDDIELTGSNKYIYLRTGTNSGLWQEDNFALRFGTNNIQRLIISNSGEATFSGLVSGIAPTSDLNFATKKYVDDQTTPTPALSAVLAVGNTSGANDIIIADDQKINFGTGSDIKIYHNSTTTNANIENYTGSLYITNYADDKDIIFRSDDGSGGVTEYFKLWGLISSILISKDVLIGNDTAKLKFGASQDLQIYHDGSNSYIKDGGSGNLLITSDGASVQINKGTTENMAEFIVDGAVKLYYDSAKKFETTSTGVSITGAGVFSGNVDVDGGQLNVTSSSGLGRIELGGTTGGYIDLKAPASDDYDMRFIVSQGGNEITTASGDLKINTDNTLALTIDSSQNATFTGSVTANSFVKSGGTSSQYLMADGSVSTSTGVTGTGVNNRLAIWNGTTAIDSDSDFYVDGDTIFTANFQASGNISITGTSFLDGDVTIGDTNSAFIGMARAGANYLAATNASGYLVFRTAGSNERMRITSGGNVGIGTTSPAEKLEVSGGHIKIINSGNTNLYINANNSGSDSTIFFQETGSTKAKIQHDASNDSMLFTDGAYTDTMTLKGGKVGIGTTSPTNPLSVEATNVSDWVAEFKQGHSSVGQSYGVNIFGGTSSSDAAFQVCNQAGGGLLRVTGAGNVGIGTSSPTARLDILTNSVTGNNNIDRHIRFRADNGEQRFNFFVGRSGNSSNLQMYDSSEVVKVVLNTSDNSYFNGGNLGIGTTSPDRSLDVEGNGMAIFGTGGYSELMLRGQVEGTGTVRNVGAWHWSVRGDVGGDNDDLKLLRFNTGSYAGTAMVVRSDNGGIAIGQNNSGYSSQILSVKSETADTVFYGESTDANCFASFRDNSSTANIEYGAIGNAHVFRKDANEYMRIASNGRVGIGTTAPVALLHLKQANGANIRFENGTTNRVFTIGEGVGTNDVFSFRGNSYRSTDTLSVNFATNRVGINTISPATTLDVVGEISASDDINTTGKLFVNKTGAELRLKSTSDSGESYINFADPSDNNVGQIFYGHSDNRMIFRVNDDTRMYFNNAGNIGIATTAIPTDIYTASGGGWKVLQIGQSSQIAAYGTDDEIAICQNTYLNSSGVMQGVVPNVASASIIMVDGKTSFKRATTASNYNQTTSTSMYIHTDGNIGVGTVLPSSYDAESDDLVVFNSTTPGITIATDNTASRGAIRFADGTSGNERYRGALEYNHNGDDMFFRTSGTIKMTIDTDGNVGIGDTSPTSISANTFNLSVNSSRTDLSGAFISKANGTVKHQQYWDSSGYNFVLNSGNFKFQGGNVGIGTTSPSYKLTVADSTANGRAIQAVQSATSGTNWGFQGGAYGSGASKNIGLQVTAEGGSTNYAALFEGGNVGIGTTSPGEKLDVQGNILVGDYFKLGSSANYMGQLGLNRNIDTGGIYNSSYGAYQIQNYQGDLQFQIYNSSGGSVCIHEFFNNGNVFFDGKVAIGLTNPSYQLHVNGSAKVDGTLYSNRVAAGIPTPSHIVDSYSSTSGVFAGRFVYAGTSGSDCAMLLRLAGGSTAPSYVDFIYGSVQTGYITTNGSSTFYGSASDYRLKENVVKLNGALDRLDNLQPKRFNFITDSETIVDGFLAHEVANVVPEAIHGEKDAINEDGKIIAQGIDQSKLVPLLVAAVQELRAEVKLLKSQINS